MSLQVTTYIAVGITFLLYLVIAFWSRAKSTSDFYVAGASVGPVINGMATAADWMSAASFISMAGMISKLNEKVKSLPGTASNLAKAESAPGARRARRSWCPVMPAGNQHVLPRMPAMPASIPRRSAKPRQAKLRG